MPHNSAPGARSHPITKPTHAACLLASFSCPWRPHAAAAAADRPWVVARAPPCGAACPGCALSACVSGTAHPPHSPLAPSAPPPHSSTHGVGDKAAQAKQAQRVCGVPGCVRLPSPTPCTPPPLPCSPPLYRLPYPCTLLLPSTTHTPLCGTSTVHPTSH